MGGMDRRHHVFRQGDAPGIFILQVLDKMAASKAGKLRTGDRIIQVCLRYIFLVISQYGSELYRVFV